MSSTTETWQRTLPEADPGSSREVFSRAAGESPLGLDQPTARRGKKVVIGGVEVDDDLIDAAAAELLAAGGPAKLTGTGGILPRLIKAVLERGLAAELTQHLGYEAGDPAGQGTGNSRNGAYPKTVRTEAGQIDLDVPRDRAGTFTPALVPKGQPARVPGQSGRPARHGPAIDLDNPMRHPAPTVSTTCDTTRYGQAVTRSWEGAHQKLQRHAGWASHQGQLPIVEGTLIRLTVDRLPGERDPKPMWLWTSATGLNSGEAERIWRFYLRRFDVEHTFRLFQTNPRLDPATHPRPARG